MPPAPAADREQSPLNLRMRPVILPLCFTIPSRNGAMNLTSLACLHRDVHGWGASDEKLNHTGEEGRHRIGDSGVLRCIHIRSRERWGAGRSTGLHE